MHRSQFYDQSQDRTFDDLWAQRHALYALGQLTGDVLGSASTFVAGLGATPTGPTSLTINLAAGEIYSQAVVDGTAYGSLTSDSDQTMQQGYALAQALLLSTSGISSGQSRYTLIQASFSQVDDIPADDPTAGLLTYLNGSDPNNPQATPWSGPSNSGAPQNTRRKGVCVISTVNGTAATTGSEVPPNPSGGSVGLYLVDLAFGQATIAANQILIAGPSVGTNVPSNYPVAPFLAGLVKLPVVGSNAGNPNGLVAGTAWPALGTPNSPNKIVDTTNNIEWNCTTSGSALSAVWQSPALAAGALTQFGAYTNKIRNASATIWQRGTSLVMAAGTALTSPSIYSADGFGVTCAGATVTVSQAGANSAAYAPNGLRITGQAGVTSTKIIIPIESVVAAPLAGRKCVFQFKMLNNAIGNSPTFTLKHANSADVWSASTTDVNGAVLKFCPASGAVTQCSWSGTVNASAGNGLSITLDFGATLNGALNMVFYDWDFRILSGTVVPIPEIRDISAEQLQAQRYLPAYYATQTQSVIGIGGEYNDTVINGTLTVPFYTPPRVVPTGLSLSSLSHFGTNFRGNVNTITGNLILNGNGCGPNVGALTFLSSGFTPFQGEATNLYAQSASARMLFTGAELNGSAL